MTAMEDPEATDDREPGGARGDAGGGWSPAPGAGADGRGAGSAGGGTTPGFPVVGVGASAGGLPAFRTLLHAMGDAPGVAVVYVQHLSPDHESMIASILAKDTTMPVEEAGDATRIERDHVYVIPPGKYLTMADHGLFLEPPVPKGGLRMPVDHFLGSLAQQLGDRAVAVILSGTGTDGASGVREVKAAGGLVVAQRAEEAEYDGMPLAAMRTGMVDVALPVGEIPRRVADYVSHPYARRDAGADAGAGSSGDAYATITALLSAQTDHDFRAYRRDTMVRRVMRRMSLHRLSDPDRYLRLLRSEPDELKALFSDLLIGVTRFFREPEAWAELEREVLPGLVRGAIDGGRPLRAWVPGCSTGEEAYTLAILLHEAAEREGHRLEYQVFATDLNEAAIVRARAGAYPPNVADDVPEERLRRHFHEEEGQLRPAKSIRERLVFAPHNLLRDPPFLRTDLVSCRNLLIYLEPRMQRHVVDVFAFSLRRGGALILGSSEGAASDHLAFEPVSARWRIHRKTAHDGASVPIAERRPPPAEWVSRTGEGGEREADGIVAAAQGALLARFAPASIVVGADGAARYFAGPVGRFLRIPAGAPTTDVMAMAPPELRTRLRSALHQARSRRRPVRLVAPAVPLGEGARTVIVEAEPVTRGEDPSVLVCLSAEAEEAAAEPRRGGDDPRDALIGRLEGELRAVRDDLQSTTEELETADEELKASHEEAASVNEEMQSANEELETSREELQSMNEELATVNAQLEDKVDEMEGLYDDLSNLLRSTDIAVLFLDDALAIRRFTPAATALLDVIDADVGRPAEHLALAGRDETLLRDARAVQDHLAPVQAELGLDGRWFARSIRPFRTSENQVDGVVVVYVDVTEQRRAVEALARRGRQQAAAAELGRAAIEMDGVQAFLRRACDALIRTLGADHARVLRHRPASDDFEIVAGAGWPDDGPNAPIPGGRGSQAGYTRIARRPVVVDDLRQETRFEVPSHLVESGARSGMSCMVGPEDGTYGVVSVHATEPRRFAEEDAPFLLTISSLIFAAVERERVTRELAERERTMRLVMAAARVGAFVFDPVADAAEIDATTRRLFDIDPGEPVAGALILSRVLEEDRDAVTAALERALRGVEPYRAEFRVRRRDDTIRWIAGFGDLAGAEGDRRVFGVNFDVTERKAIEEQQRFTARELDHRVKNVLATVAAIASITGRSAEGLGEFQRSFSARIQSLARMHSRLADASWNGMDLREILDEELAPYRAGEMRLTLTGPFCALPPSEAQTLSLAVHELATNAAKHGAIRRRGGIDVSWFLEGDGETRRLEFHWRESGVGPLEEPSRRGFGTSVIRDMVAAQLGAEVAMRFGADGLEVGYVIPLRGTTATLAGAGALRTQREAAPATGPIDPMAEPAADPIDLSGRRVLVVEDEYLVLMQVREFLSRRGAEVVGPALRLKDALSLAEEPIDAALLDVNLGGESVAPLAEALEERGVPFVFATGYGGRMDLPGAAPRVRKPIEPAALDDALRRIIGIQKT